MSAQAQIMPNAHAPKVSNPALLKGEEEKEIPKVLGPKLVEKSPINFGLEEGTMNPQCESPSEAKDLERRVSNGSAAEDADTVIRVKNTFLDYQDPSQVVKVNKRYQSDPTYSQHALHNIDFDKISTILEEMGQQVSPKSCQQALDMLQGGASFLEPSHETTALPETDAGHQEVQENLASSTEMFNFNMVLNSMEMPEAPSLPAPSMIPPKGKAHKILSAPLMGTPGLPVVGEYTTLRVRRLPLWMSEPKQVAELLDRLGFDNPRVYDYLYVPVNFQNWGIKGYAFINCISAEAAEAVASALAGLGHEPCWAREQGKEANVRKYQHTPLNNRRLQDGDVLDPRFHPLLWEQIDGGWQQIPFPEPTRPVGTTLASSGAPRLVTPNYSGCAAAQATPSLAEAKNNKVFMSNLSPKTSEEDIKRVLLNFGNVLDVTIIIDRRSGISKGFGFAEFEAGEGVRALFDSPCRNKNSRNVEAHLVMPDQSIAVMKPYTGNRQNQAWGTAPPAHAEHNEALMALLGQAPQVPTSS